MKTKLIVLFLLFGSVCYSQDVVNKYFITTDSVGKSTLTVTVLNGIDEKQTIQFYLQDIYKNDSTKNFKELIFKSLLAVKTNLSHPISLKFIPSKKGVIWKSKDDHNLVLFYIIAKNNIGIENYLTVLYDEKQDFAATF